MGCGADIVIFDELLLFANHVLQIDDRPCLQLQVQQELHILTLQEVVLHDELEEVSIVLELDPVGVADGIADVADLRIVLVQILLHRLSLE